MQGKSVAAVILGGGAGTRLSPADLASVGALRTRLRDVLVDGGVHLLVDLRDVTFMDSAGLGALVAIRKQARVFRGSFGVVAPSRQVRRLLELTSLDKVFPCFDSLEEAAGVE